MSELSITFPSSSAGGSGGVIVGAGTVVVTSGSGFTVVSGTGITVSGHETIDSLVHNISEDTHTELIRNGNGQVTQVNQYQYLSGPLVRRTDITRNSNGQVTSTVDRQYDELGNLVQSLTTNIVRDSNGTVTTITTDEVP